MVKNFKITIEYDGTNYHGWQRQKNDRTIQAEIEKALLKMNAAKIPVTGSGRTDAGVHALGQIANFHCRTHLAADVFQRALNSLLPEDIIIQDCHPVAEAFHARYDAQSKIYNYKILNRPIPAAIGRQYAWFIPKKLSLEAMRAACRHITGEHDFKAFEGTGSPRSSTVRHVMMVNLFEFQADLLIFEIEANGFLRFMVRNIVGTLVDVGLGKITPDGFKHILESKDRSQAGATAPPHGLCLVAVKY